MTTEQPGHDDFDEADQARLPLSVVIDRMAGDGPRDEAFVHRFSEWFHEHADRLRLDSIDALGLEDVVLTFRMKGHVALVAAGHHPNHPGDVTIRFHERDFPYVTLVVGGPPVPTPYEVCTLDYAVEGRPVALRRAVAGSALQPAGAVGRAVVAATIGGRREVRVVFDGGPAEALNVPPDALVWLDTTAPAVSPADDAAEV